MEGVWNKHYKKKKKKVMVSEEKRADPFRQADLMKYIAFSDS